MDRCLHLLSAENAHFPSPLPCKLTCLALLQIHQYLIGHIIGVGQYPVLYRQKLCFECSIGGPLLESGYYLCQPLNHYCLDGRTKFPLPIQKPQRLAAGCWGGQGVLCHKVCLSFQVAWHINALPFIKAGSITYNNALRSKSQLRDIKLDVYSRSSSHLTVEAKST